MVNVVGRYDQDDKYKLHVAYCKIYRYIFKLIIKSIKDVIEHKIKRIFLFYKIKRIFLFYVQ